MDRGEWNCECRGEIRRYSQEHQWRRRLTGSITDAEARKRGEQTGLDTLVVHAVNDECQPLVGLLTSGAANALSIPPGEYGRKIKTQRN